MAVNWGSVPDWLAGISALVALLFAALAARAAWEASKLQTAQLRALEDAEYRRSAAEEREQAAKLAVWIRMTQDEAPAVAVFNGSGLPVYNLSVGLTLNRSRTYAFVEYAVKGPDVSPKVLTYASRELIERASELLHDKDENISWSDLYRTGDLALTASFTDASGRSWLRAADGKLQRLE